MLEELTLIRDGVPIRYACSDTSSEKPALLFVVPFGLKLDLTTSFFERFKASHRVICWEARLVLAAEDRPITPQDFTVEQHVGDLFAVLDACNASVTDVVGYCSGAGITLAAATTKPERFRSLVLVSGEYTLLDKPACMTQFGRDVDSLLPMASRDKKSAQFILDRMPAQNKQAAERKIPDGINLPFTQVNFFQRFALCYLSYRAVDFEKLASKIPHRTLLVAGERDLQTNVESMRQIRKHVGDASIFIEPEGDHYEVLRADSRVMTAIYEFLTGECQSVREQPSQLVDTACV